MKKLLFGAIVSTFLLTGCSNVTNSKELKMGEVFNSGKEHISYVVDGSEDIDKDSEIEMMIVTKDGKSKLYNIKSDTTLGDMAKLDDDKKKEKMLKDDKKYFKTMKGFKLDQLKSHMYYINHKDDENLEGDAELNSLKMDDVKKSYDEAKNIKYKEPEFKDIELTVFTDGSGNETSSETFTFVNENHYFNIDPAEYNVSISVPKYPFEIYDKKYAGFYSQRKEIYLITEVGDKVETPMFDSQDDKYVDKVD
ncbi:hypothetical protein TP70_00155 [Staphylococcus microti]|uniref:Lipoprotein n=1 Tax=Staphylococcus microti TaxID=569857 RepID=A0A0D6XSV1_9STAP|nr:membrane lipoprotein lipid attachment site-containing protein [Staphylococcus microti]KIX91874.1 hypothetical protein TP70_00155 [Staphylococcus microti]PNZ84021.1 hypothetical protein CD132_01235 [Staphylococcus microti]SUM56508.1 Uncharacterised protein [Staphylococcus microti]